MSKKYPMLVVCIIFFALMTVGSSPMPDNRQKVNIDYNFSIDLLRILSQKDSYSNHIVSPLGIENNLSVLYVGSSGKTKQQIAKLLDTSQKPVEFLNQQRIRMDTLIKSGNKDKITFEYANIMLADDTYCKFKKTFEKNIVDSKMCKLKKSVIRIRRESLPESMNGAVNTLITA